MWNSSPSRPLIVITLAAACAPALDLEDRQPCSSPPLAETGGVVVRPDPSASLEGVLPSTRFELLASPPPSPSTVALVEGDVGPGHLRQLEDGAPSEALRERMLPITSFEDDEGRIWVQPERPLTPEVSLTLAVGSHGSTTAIGVVPDPEAASFVFPPDGLAAGAPFGVWCRGEALPLLPATASLAPGGEATVTRGAAGLGEACLTVRVAGEYDHVVPRVDALRLSPQALRTGGKRTPAAPLACEGAEHSVGPGCLAIFDDRARLRGPAEGMLWSVSGALEEVLVLDGTSAWLHPLHPDTAIALHLGWQGIDGTAAQVTVEAITRPPQPHLVITEVLANPIGPEPQQEWVEIHNDGLVAAPLAGWTLRDVGGETPLPSVVLPPGATAVLVRDDFDPTLDYDPPVPDAVRLPVGPALGTHGLSNGGEPIDLHDPDGLRVSRVPMLPKPKAGLSVARRHPRSADDDPDAFVLAEPTPGVVP